MSKKQLYVFAAILLLAIISIMVWGWTKPNSPATNVLSGKSNNAVSESSRPIQPGQNNRLLDEIGDIDPPSTDKPSYQLAKATSSFDPIANAKRKASAPFKIQGRGSKAKILGSDGKLLIQADEKVGIYGCEVSPSGKRIVVYYGDAKYDIITPDTGETIRLPRQPPGENVLGFASWNWIDDQTLLGVSAKTIPFRDDQVGTEREEPIISRSVLYLYDLKKQTMSEVALPPAMRTKTVSVSAIDKAGKVQLRPEGRSESYTDASLGWFEVRSQK